MPYWNPRVISNLQQCQERRNRNIFFQHFVICLLKTRELSVRDSVTRFSLQKQRNFWHFLKYEVNLCEVISNRRLIGGWRFLYENCSKLSNLQTKFGGFVYDNLQWYLMLSHGI